MHCNIQGQEPSIAFESYFRLINVWAFSCDAFKCYFVFALKTESFFFFPSNSFLSQYPDWGAQKIAGPVTFRPVFAGYKSHSAPSFVPGLGGLCLDIRAISDMLNSMSNNK